MDVVYDIKPIREFEKVTTDFHSMPLLIPELFTVKTNKLNKTVIKKGIKKV